MSVSAIHTNQFVEEWVYFLAVLLSRFSYQARQLKDVAGTSRMVVHKLMNCNAQLTTGGFENAASFGSAMTCSAAVFDGAPSSSASAAHPACNFTLSIDISSCTLHHPIAELGIISIRACASERTEAINAPVIGISDGLQYFYLEVTMTSQ
jgi:hypothetical protein